MKYMAIIDADEKPVSCKFIGCNGNVAPYLIGETNNIKPLEQPEWIPVEDKLPERDVDVLTYHRNESFDYQYVSWIDDYSGKWCGFCGNLPDEVLAWMPLPEPYKAESDKEE